VKCDCGQDVAPDTVLCGGCGRFVDHSRVAPDAGVAPPPAPPAPGPEADATPPGPLGSVGPLSSAVPGAPGIQRCAVDWCPGIVAPGASACDAYGHPATPSTPAPTASPVAGGPCELVLPDGTAIDLADGVPLEIGRHAPDPRVAAALAPFDQVGRRQATVVLRGGLVEVTHLGRTNPTYANGQPAAPAVTLTPPVDVRIGRELHLTVRRKGNNR